MYFQTVKDFIKLKDWVISFVRKENFKFSKNLVEFNKEKLN